MIFPLKIMAWITRNKSTLFLLRKKSPRNLQHRPSSCRPDRRSSRVGLRCTLWSSDRRAGAWTLGTQPSELFEYLASKHLYNQLITSLCRFNRSFHFGQPIRHTFSKDSQHMFLIDNKRKRRFVSLEIMISLGTIFR